MDIAIEILPESTIALMVLVSEFRIVPVTLSPHGILLPCTISTRAYRDQFSQDERISFQRNGL